MGMEILIIVALVIGGGIWWMADAAERSRQYAAEERRLAAERERLDAEERERKDRILTSSTNRIVGKKIIRQIRMVRVYGCMDQSTAEDGFLYEVEKAGGNAAINMAVRRHQGGYISIQGDAVVIE